MEKGPEKEKEKENTHTYYILLFMQEWVEISRYQKSTYFVLKVKASLNSDVVKQGLYDTAKTFCK
jgi:hypothetical protein